MIDRLKKEAFGVNFYDEQEIKAVFEAVKDTQLELPVMMATFYGLRRNEVINLKWDAVDFEAHTIKICKSKYGNRTLPLIPVFCEKLLALKAEQEINRALYGDDYCDDYLGYICVNQNGELIKPGYITTEFSTLLKKKSLRIMRFQELRHICASILHAHGVSMKKTLEWLGLSDSPTVTSIYVHSDLQSRNEPVEVMLAALGLADKAMIVEAIDTAS